MMAVQNKQTEKVYVNPYVALIIGISAVSTGAIFARMADASPITVAAYRVGLATLMIAPFACFKAKNELNVLSKHDLISGMLAGFFLSLHFITWISSLSFTSVANSVLFVNTNPLWVGLLSPAVTRERIGKGIAVSIMTSIIGVSIIGMEDFVFGGKAILGDLLALCGAICASAYLMLGRNLRRRLSLLAYVFMCYGSAAIILWTIVLVLQIPARGFSYETYLSLWALALIPQLIGHTTYNWALKWLSTSVIAVSLLGEPVGSTILAYFIFDESLTLQKAVGGLLVLFAIYIAGISEKSKIPDFKVVSV